MQEIIILKEKVIETKKEIYVGTSCNVCLMCGKPDIPEGTEICHECENKYS